MSPASVSDNFIIYDARHVFDSRHAALFQGYNLINYDFSGHPTSRFLADVNHLSSLILYVVSPVFDRSVFMGMLLLPRRHYRRSPVYLENLLGYLLRVRRFKLASIVAARLRSSDSVSDHGLVLCSDAFRNTHQMQLARQILDSLVKKILAANDNRDPRVLWFYRGVFERVGNFEMAIRYAELAISGSTRIRNDWTAHLKTLYLKVQ